MGLFTYYVSYFFLVGGLSGPLSLFVRDCQQLADTPPLFVSDCVYMANHPTSFVSNVMVRHLARPPYAINKKSSYVIFKFSIRGFGMGKLMANTTLLPLPPPQVFQVLVASLT